MSADVRNTAVVQDYNLIRVPDRGNALRDNDLGYMRAFSAKSLIQRSFGLEVKSAGRVVKYQDLVLFQYGTGNGDALFLTAGQGMAAFGNGSIITVGFAADEFIRLCDLRSLLDLAEVSVILGPTDILFDTAGVHLRLLHDNRDFVTQGV